MKRRFVLLAALGLLAVGLPAGLTSAAAPPAPYYNGFETDISDWDAFGGAFNATRVASGTNGITSASGNFHAQNSASGSASRWGGYNYGAGNAVATVFHAYSTSVDIYLDVAGGWANNTRFDFSSAINNSLGTHRRDFIFNAGFYNDTDGSPGSGTSRFVISASNNSQPGSAFAKNPAKGPIAISTSGWYTFTHRFYDSAGVLAVEMSIRDASSALVNTWTLSDITDLIAGIGGNRYGWFAYNQFTTLAFDNATRFEPTPPCTTVCYVDPAGDDSNPGTLAEPKKTIQAGVNVVSLGGTVLVADGTYTENVLVNKNLKLISANGRASTTIVGISGVGRVGAVQVTGGTTAFQLGDIGQGFTIEGVDNGLPGIENAAVYFQGAHSNAKIIGNELVAKGDSGLTTEFAANNNFLIDSNVFSGQTFVGPNPADYGFANQFTTPNVPRQLVVIQSSAGSGTTFSNNQVTGTAGGYNLSAQEQGNTLVTIDTVNSTISGNTFAGVTSRFATSLRVRNGGNSMITGNIFDSTGIQFPAMATGHVFLSNMGQTVAQVDAANTYDSVWYVSGSATIGTIYWTGPSPVYTPPADQVANEGSSTSFSLGSFSDLGVNDFPWVVDIDWGDSATDSFSTNSQGSLGSLNHTYADDGPYTVTVTVTDNFGRYDSDTFGVAVSNVDPDVTAGPDQNADEGENHSFNLGSFSDPGTDDDPWVVTVDWGDLSTDTTFNTNTQGGSLAASHAYADNGSYTVTVCVTDKDGGDDCATFKVIIANVAPTVTLTGPTTANQGDTKLFTFTTTDPGADAFALVSQSCGGGVLSAPAFNPVTGAGSFSCTFNVGPASHTVSARVRDDDNANSNLSTVAVTVASPRATKTKIRDELVALTGLNANDRKYRNEAVSYLNQALLSGNWLADGRPRPGTFGEDIFEAEEEAVKLLEKFTNPASTLAFRQRLALVDRSMANRAILEAPLNYDPAKKAKAIYYFNLGNSEYAAGRYDKAIEAYEAGWEEVVPG